MLAWIIIVVAVIIVFFILKFNHLKHRIYTFALGGILLFLGISAYYIIVTNNIHLTDLEGIMKFFSIYFSWLGNLFVNGKEITANAINMDWGGNSSLG